MNERSRLRDAQHVLQDLACHYYRDETNGKEIARRVEEAIRADEQQRIAALALERAKKIEARSQRASLSYEHRIVLKARVSGLLSLANDVLHGCKR